MAAPFLMLFAIAGEEKDSYEEISLVECNYSGRY